MKTPHLLIVAVCWPLLCGGESAAPSADAGREQSVASGDLHLLGPAREPEHGLPLGNGRMGSMVWTTPGAIHFQINRPDVYGNDKDSTSFPKRHGEYCGGCGFVDLDFGAKASIFTVRHTRQDLSIYNGLATLAGDGVSVRLVAHPAKDVIAVEISGQRAGADSVNAVLRMLRPPRVMQFEHTATSALRAADGRLLLTQEFKEGAFVCRTAVALAAGDGATVRDINDQAMELTARPAAAGATAGCRTFYVASAASFDPREDVAAQALRLAGEAEQAGFDRLAAETAAWWHRFWEGPYVRLASADGAAALVQSHYYYFLYLMGASSRGRLPPKFNGMLWNARGDGRMWGAMHWWHNVSCFYDALPATGHWELMDPMYDMYSGMRAACEQAARDGWGSAGVWIPETVYFNGPPALPPDIAAELRDFLLCRKPPGELSAAFRAFAARRHPHFPGGITWSTIAGTPAILNTACNPPRRSAT